MAELLIELFSEEIPARMQAKARSDFHKMMEDGLKEAGLTMGATHSFVTPRRLVFVADDLPTATPDIREERKGPREGAPEKALEGFMRGAGVTKDQLTLKDVKGNQFYFATIEKAGEPTPQVVATVLKKIIRNFPWPKSQRWGDGTLKWVRPLRSILCVFDGAVVPFELDGFTASNVTYGHRFMAPDPITVERFTQYRSLLLDAYVKLDATERATFIADSCQTLAAAAGLDFQRDEGLLKEVAGLVEWPVPMLGSFDPEFLKVPEEVLILTMRQDQKYFVLRDPATGKLAPKFIFTANIEPTDGGTAVTAGNERVLSARLSDARYFYETDLKATLESRLPKLADITFHKDLGTLQERVDRIAALSKALAEHIPGCDPELAEQAAKLCKADLVSQMVYEFPEVQGVMGRYYAEAEGLDQQIADALEDHYKPVGPSDDCPTAPVSVAVALAEKIDTLVGFFGINQPPTGSKDPFALRRAALGVIRLITENGLRVELADLSKHETLFAFFQDRLKVIMRDQGVRHDLIDAVFALGKDDLVDVLNRVRALQSFLGTDDGVNLLAGFKRANNILEAERKKGALPEGLSVDASHFAQGEEGALHTALTTANEKAAPALQSEDYEAVMAAMAGLRAPIDAFFNEVTVNADDPALRSNRLALLDAIVRAVDTVADFRLIEG